mmetsp:Transcript_15861/g.28795  ORF Transcript_15861/g.28795 Transcript_15861/m.28795 type:complete len:543 (-) Transcript_15861:83-1711(-)|eukprot:CAMPEP_0201931866 /NCGR_PEP_ID=MMETSP0903-20130614/28288_1 /ASSEMBLY_ACC=CAM_ASM_000552 /TAXON_ID=420261 /ORGANISM="Thalassiosira antarctica, Strain CCMP982" /LENGTH=542 /DNA_ID=CAMNT_0048471305 /DNA_START=134 /DNA_END=1762 /DNA_ORIENTATION=+
MSEPQDKGADYYATGSAELATESALLLQKLSQRLELTKSDERLVIVLVGMPGCGKSFIARKLQNFLQWIGTECKVFNVGKYRRVAADGNCGADFFDSKNESAAALRQEVARLALEDMLNWIDEPFENGNNGSEGGLFYEAPVVKGRVGIFDATNSTKERRDWVLEQCTDEVKRAGKPTGVVFIESVCNDPDLMRENLLTKISTSPDYTGVPVEEAMVDIMNRCKKYEEAYESIEDDEISYIKIFNLSSKMMVNHIYGLMAKTIVPALMAWNIGTRSIYLCRPAADTSGGDFGRLQLLSSTPRRRSRQTLVMSKKESLDDVGKAFKGALYKFMRKECLDFADRRRNETVKPKINKRRGRGSILGCPKISKFGLDDGEDEGGPFPCHIATSTIPRACETVAWKHMTSKAVSHLNPLDKGEFTGMSMKEIATKDPGWYERYVADPFNTRFPGGECQADLMLRLEPAAISVEQQVEPTLVVSHTCVLQALVAYFRNSPAETCMDIDVPLNTVFKFTPAKGGGWGETQHCILSEEKKMAIVSEEISE